MANGSSDDAKSQALEGEIVNHPPPVALTKHDERTVQLLEAAFNNMFNITEACEYAGISRETFYTWLADDDIFSFRMSVARKAPNKKAKENIAAALAAGDTNVSRWYLERKDPDFKPKADLTVHPELVKTRDKIRDFLDDPSDLDDPSGQSAPADPGSAGDEVAGAPSDIS